MCTLCQLDTFLLFFFMSYVNLTHFLLTCYYIRKPKWSVSDTTFLLEVFTELKMNKHLECNNTITDIKTCLGFFLGVQMTQNIVFILEVELFYVFF